MLKTNEDEYCSTVVSNVIEEMQLAKELNIPLSKETCNITGAEWQGVEEIVGITGSEECDTVTHACIANPQGMWDASQNNGSSTIV